MELGAREVAAALQAHGVTSLFHANTVQTGSTFLRQGLLMSRGAVEDAGLPQTPQSSDAKDQQFGIWHDVFLDSVDIHYRARRRNLYGPVTFEFPIRILEGPEISFVWITKRNPIYWRDGQEDEERYYTSVAEFDAEFTFGDYYKHIMVRHRDSTSLSQLERVLLDNPGYVPDDLFRQAMDNLRRAAHEGGVAEVSRLQERTCRFGCQCVNQYDRLAVAMRAHLFAA